MSDAEFAAIMQQHTQLWTAVVVLAFLQLLFMLGMVFAAVWSVRSVTKRQDATEAKWNELVSLLIHNAREVRRV